MKRWYGIQVDLAEVLDRYSILEVKYNNCKETKLKTQIAARKKQLENWIIKDMGTIEFQKIIKSKEYNDLYEANQYIYNSIEVAEKDEEWKILSAHQLNNINKKRTIVKRLIMNKFFLSEPDEIKMKEGRKV